VLLVGAGDSATDIAAILIKFGVGSLHISIRNDATFDDWEDLPETGFCEVDKSAYANGMFSCGRSCMCISLRMRVAV